ncbi:hypothetical protein ASG99_16475 [Bacillus sp. Soil768D1]|nr:hypothetical protein ASG99_16475 [Bacillus sp. Soil768D1]
MRFLTSIFIVLTLLSGCSKNEQPISIQKHVVDKDYSFVAYKENIESNKSLKVMEILNKANWEKSKLDLDKVGHPDYLFYFNKHKKGTKIVVYSVWASPGRDKLELTKDDGSKYVQLNKDDSELIFETITSFNSKEN